MPLASNAALEQILERYRKQYASEQRPELDDAQQAAPSLSLPYFLATTKAADLYHRRNFNGHLTASAFILSADGKNVLLLHHKSLNRWLQPGGHIDATDNSILDAAYREVVEETGIAKKHLRLLCIESDVNVPFDIDSHIIPANPKKNEAEHVHHDFRFLLQIVDDTEIQIRKAESNDFRWISLNDLLEIEDHRRVAEKIIAIVS